jgi:putative oxidoreductase
VFTLMRLFDKLYGWFLRAANACQSVFLLAIRLYWGWQFWQAGWGKLHSIPKVTDYFTSLGIPAPGINAWFISLLETVGGILLALGLFSRPLALMLTVDMIVAYIVGDRDALHSIFSDPDKFYAAAPYTFLFASLIILFFGPGKISLDNLIVWYRKKRAPHSDVAVS